MPSSQDKVVWTNIALSWNFLQCGTALWRDPCFIWKKQNRISTTLIGISANPRPTQHWLCCTTCNHEAILDPPCFKPICTWSGWECELIVLYTEISSTQISSSFLFFEKKNIFITITISFSFCDIYRSRFSLAAGQWWLYDATVALHPTAEHHKDRMWSQGSDCSCCSTHRGLYELYGQ